MSMKRSHVATPSFGSIAYSESGTGPVALFVHGVFLSADLWGSQCLGLSDLRRCIAIDLLAHGGSPLPPGHLTIGVQASMVLEFLDALDIGEVDLVGNDTGGAVAQIVVARQPDRVRSLTLTNCDVHDNFPPEAFLPICDLARQGLLAGGLVALSGDPSGIRTALLAGFEDPEKIPDETLLGFFGGLASEERAEALQDYVAGMEPSEMVAIRDDLARFVRPTLVVWGTDDVFFPVRWVDWLEATIPGVGHTVRIEGARLFFPLERPEALNDALREFWTVRPRR